MGAKGVMGAVGGMEVLPMGCGNGDGLPCVFLLAFVGRFICLGASPFLSGWAVMEVMVGVRHGVVVMETGMTEVGVCLSTFTNCMDETGGCVVFISRALPLSRLV